MKPPLGIACAVAVLAGCASAPDDAPSPPVLGPTADLGPRRVSRHALELLEARIRVHAQAIEAAQTGRVPSKLLPSGHDLDVALDGDGFFQVQLPGGALAYTRDGQLVLDAQRRLAVPSGHPLYPTITVPDGAAALQIDPDGRVIASAGEGRPGWVLGQIELARFAQPAYLSLARESVLRATDASGPPTIARPGRDGAAVLAQGFVEASSVAIYEADILLRAALREYAELRRALQ